MGPGSSSPRGGSGWRRGRGGIVVASWLVVVEEKECPMIVRWVRTRRHHCRIVDVGGIWDALGMQGTQCVGGIGDVFEARR